MGYSIPTLAHLASQFERMPAVGRKSAQRMAFYVLGLNDDEAKEFADAIMEARRTVKCCKVCQTLSDTEICPVCDDPKRDHSVICVVEDVQAVMAFERTREFNGVYHVLHGVISPLDGIGPEQLRVRELMARLSDDSVKEVIMATNPTVDGEATASYLARCIKPMGIKVTRLAYGIPVGASLEFTDDITISRALEGRGEV